MKAFQMAFRVWLFRFLPLCLVLSVLVPVASDAAQITARSLAVSTSSPASASATTTYTFTFTVPTTGTAIKSFDALICTTASGTCTTPTGFSNSSSTLASQPSNLGAASGWTVNTATAGDLRIVNASNATTPSASQTVTFGNVQNPTTANQTFYARLTTYSDSTWTTAVDTGTTAASTAQPITLTATVDEILLFCVYTSSSCGGGGSTVALGTLDPTLTGTGTSKMDAGTNAGNGYVISVVGNTLTSGSHTIAPMASANSSNQGTPQFGLNLVANTTPSVGAAVSPAVNGSNFRGQASSAGGYASANNFKFNSGDTVADSTHNGVSPYSSDTQTFTISYIANIGASQPAGSYQATLTYVCTATY